MTSPSTVKGPSTVLSPTTPHTPTLNQTPRTILQYSTSDGAILSTPTQYMMTPGQHNGSEGAMPVQGWVIQHPGSVDNTGTVGVSDFVLMLFSLCLGLHPLQQALLLHQQQQYVQVRDRRCSVMAQGFCRSCCLHYGLFSRLQGQQQMYIQPSTPIVQPFSPMVSSVSTPRHHHPSTPMEYAPQPVTVLTAPPPPPPSQQVVSSAAMKLLQMPMSSLGKLLSGDKPAPSFPDPSSLKLPTPSLADGGDLFCRPLAESWWTVPLETCLRGVRQYYDNCCVLLLKALFYKGSAY